MFPKQNQRSPEQVTGRNSILGRIGQFLAIAAASASLLAWSGGLSALTRKHFDPPVPQWLLIVLVVIALVGAFLLLAKLIRTKAGQWSANTLILCIFLPLFATVFGGVYSWGGMWISKGKDPMMTFLLAIGVGISVFGFGFATEMELPHMLFAFVISLAGLLLLKITHQRSPIGPMAFGGLHFLSLFLTMILASIENDQRQKEALMDRKPALKNHQQH